MESFTLEPVLTGPAVKRLDLMKERSRVRRWKILPILALLLAVATGTTAQTTYNVTIEEGTEDADNWTVTPNPAEAGKPLKVTYTGSLKVKSLKAKEDMSKIETPQGYDRKMYIADAPVYVRAGEHWLIEGDGSEVRNTITIGKDAIVTLSNVNISDSSACIKCRGNATIILADGTTNTLTNKNVQDDYPALWAGPAGTTLTIQGSGSLNATCIGCGAGIGGGYNIACGDIVIKGGDITAVGGDASAGIGSGCGFQKGCGNILISDGNIIAISSKEGAGIGSGLEGTCGSITINGGTITATGGMLAPAIGCGLRGTCGDITISNPAIVEATKGWNAGNCIGSGESDRNCGTVTINGTVTGSISTSPFTTYDMLDTYMTQVTSFTDEEWLELGGAVELTKTADGEWTLAEMPHFDIVLEIEYESAAFDLTVGESEHGTVTFTVDSVVATQAEKGDIVTLTVTPDEGYSLKDLTVRAYTSWEAAVRAHRAPALLNDIVMTKQDDGTWQFIMPKANVWVVVTYTKDLQDAWIQPIASMTYTGEALTPTVVVKDGDIILSAVTDYIVTYADNVSVGQATVTVTAREGADYGGTATATFTIAQADLPEEALKRIAITIPAKSYVARIDEEIRQIETAVEGVSLFSVKSVSDTEVELTAPLTLVDAEMPYLIYNDNDVEKTINIVVSSEEADSVTYDSEHFKGTLTDKTFTEEEMQAADHFLLTDGNDFVWVKDAGTLAAGKCWIEFPVSVAHPRQFVIVNKGAQTQTAISSIDNGKSTTANWYDLSGRRITRPTKGISVRNGKKIILVGARE